MVHSPVASVVRTAKEFVGQKEFGGSNRGDLPDFCNLWTIRDMRDYPMGGRGAMWCATFAILVLYLAIGEDCPIPHRPEYSDVDNLVKWAKDNRVFNVGSPNVGDLFVIPGRDGGWIHVGIVIDVLDEQHIETVEGNTNDDGSANGDGVYKRVRNIQGLGFIRWMAVNVI